MKGTKIMPVAALLFFFLFTMVPSGQGQAPADWFITEWDLSKVSPTTSSIIFPGEGTGYSIEWEQKDNPATNGTLTGNGFTTINFPVAGVIYQIKVHRGSGSFSRINCGNVGAGPGTALVALTQWGNTQWSTFNRAFSTCNNFETLSATDSPDLTQVTDMEFMFSGASKFNQPLNFNTSNVTNMLGMFSGAAAFNQPLNFNTSNVTNMWNMFANASSFNQPLNFNTAAVTNMGLMFNGASSFNQPLNFNTAAVTSMNTMFGGATSFNQPLNFNTAAVTDMFGLFYNATAFNQDLGHWDLSSLVDGIFMFGGSGMNCLNYTNTLNAWAANPSTNTGVDFTRQNNMLYSDANTANGRSKLMDPTASGGLGWDIQGDATDDGACYALSLPVVFGSISARQDRGGLQVNWQTLSEKNVAKFTVQGSADGRVWKNLSTIASQAPDGNADEVLNYSYTGNGLLLSAIGLLGLLLFLPALRRSTARALLVLGVIVFALSCEKNDTALKGPAGSIELIRIAQEDFDGSVQYSKVVKVIRE